MKSMHSLFTFEVIEKIFNQRAEQKTSSLAKMLYLNCLMAHFRDKEANEKNATGFELFRNEIKNYDKWSTQFIELHKAKLISVTSDMLVFHNHWGTFLDRTEIVLKENIKITIGAEHVEEYHNYLIENKHLVDLIAMKNKWTQTQILEVIDLFMKEQLALCTQYNSTQDCVRHLISWIGINAQKLNIKTQASKSKNKIIGL
jgi:hypothetical protein